MQRSFICLIFAIASILGLQGCSQMDVAPQRKFSVEADWVTQLTQSTILGYRKIHRSSPILFSHPVHGKLVITGNSIDGIVALSVDSGKIVWRSNIAHGVEATMALRGDFLFVGGGDGNLYSISALTGQPTWTFPMRNQGLSEPIFEDGLVLALSGGNTLFAIDASSGKQTWLYTRQDTQAITVRGGSRPAVKNGLVILGFSDGAVVALNSKTGVLKWEKQLNKNKRFRDIDSDPVFEGDYVYIAGFDNAIYCLRSTTGEMVWKLEKGGFGAALVLGENLIVSGTQGEVFALDKTNGKKKWSYEGVRGIASSPKLYKGLIAIGESQGSLLFLEPSTGKRIGGFDPGRGVFSSPTIDEASGRVYFISNEANAYAMKVGWLNAVRFPFLR